MFTSLSEAVRPLAAVAMLGLSACTLEPPEYRFGTQVTNLRFNLFSEDMGIHPNDDVLADPENPFRFTGVGDVAKFDLLAAGGNVASFYAWATLLATGPNGENQFYAATSLEAIADSGEIPEEQRPIVRQMAIRGYQALLDYFPDARTFAANGIQSFRLATPAYLGIVRLGGIPRGEWVLVETADGGQEAVWASGGIVTPFEEPDEEPTAPGGGS